MSKTHDFKVIFDVCAEYEKSQNDIDCYLSYPLIDLVIPTIEELSIGVEKLDDLIRNNDKVFIHCALGMSRSATLVFSWLLYSNKIKTVNEGYDFFHQNNYQFKLSGKHKNLLTIYCEKHLNNDRTNL